jgi:hypothetical protein
MRLGKRVLEKRIAPFDSGRVAARGTFGGSVGVTECPQLARIIAHTAGVVTASIIAWTLIRRAEGR